MLQWNAVHAIQRDFGLDLSCVIQSIMIEPYHIKSSFLIISQRMKVIVCCDQSDSKQSRISCFRKCLMEQSRTCPIIFLKTIK